MRAVRSALIVTSIALAGLAGCESLPPDLVLTYGAQGVVIQAERLVADVYGKPSKPLPYGSPDIDNSLASMKARWPSLRPLLDGGVIGLTEFGEIALRDAGDRPREDTRVVRDLIKAENRDRDLLYRGMTAAIGHGDDTLQLMLPYTEDRFGEAWYEQAPKGWWIRDHQGHWLQKPE